jgi:hypothetical protein
VAVNRKRLLGKVLAAFGCLWFFLILFHIQPLFLSLFFFAVWSKASNGFDEILTVVSGSEYVAALVTLATGLIVWRRSATGRWPLKMIFLILALFIVGTGTRFAMKKRAAQRRDAAYQVALSKYQRAIRPGVTRKEVEDYLGMNNNKVIHMCCVDSRQTGRHTWDDLVKIGQEDPPWYCGETNVYLAFQFVDYVQIKTGYDMNDNDLDILKAITLIHQPETCL